MEESKEKEQDREVLKRKIEDGRFVPVNNDFFVDCDAYEKLCMEDGDQEGMVSLSFYRGEAYYRMGRYEDAMQMLGNCLMYHSEDTAVTILINCYNVLGLIYSSMGYEFIALQNYLDGIDLAVQCEDYDRKIVIQVNMGWLYRDLGDYDKALHYYEQCLEDIKEKKDSLINHGSGFLSLSLSYMGQIYFKTGQYEAGLKVLERLQKLERSDYEMFYGVTAYNLLIRAYSYLKDKEQYKQIVEKVIERAELDDDFLELSESYFDIAWFVLEEDSGYAKRLIDVLKNKCNKFGLPFFNVKLQRLEVRYAEKYSSRERYLEECGKYMKLNHKYDVYNRQSKISNMLIIENLQRMQKEKEQYMERSRHDLMTGLLNKVSFEEQVAKELDHADETDRVMAMAMIDIDYFKTINDTFGHMIGDEVIMNIAQIMRQVFEGETILGRVGGDEFGVCWTKVSDVDVILQQSEQMNKMCGNCKALKIWRKK